MRRCNDCKAKIEQYNKSGYCRSCSARRGAAQRSVHPVAQGYAHAGAGITPVPADVLARVARERAERRGQQAAQSLIFLRAEIATQCEPPAPWRETKYPSRGYTITCNCGRTIQWPETACWRCRG